MDFLVGEARDVGVTVQVDREPYVFTITAATFALFMPDGVTPAPGFTYDPTKMDVSQNPDVFYQLDSTGLAPATKPYTGVFTVDIGTYVYKFIVPIVVARPRAAS